MKPHKSTNNLIIGLFTLLVAACPNTSSGIDLFTTADFKELNSKTVPKGISDPKLFTTAFPAVNKTPATVDDYLANKKAILGELANHDVYVRAYSVEADGKLTYLTASIAAKGKKIVVQQDYLNYKNVEKDGKTSKVGVVLRVQAELVTKSADVNLSGLFAIGLAVKAGSAAGQLKVQIHGMSGEPVSTLIPLPSEISESSLQTAMQAVASLKAKFYDDKVIIVPQVIPD